MELEGLEASLKATLGVLRERGPLASPNAAMVELSTQVSRPLAVFAHTVGSYRPGPEFGEIEYSAELAGEHDDWAESLISAGCDLKDTLMIGSDGGGTQYLFMAGDASDAGYALLLWAMDGQPYSASGSPTWRVGTFAQLFRHLAKGSRRLDPRFAAIAAE